MAQNEVSKDIDNLTYLTFGPKTIIRFSSTPPRGVSTYDSFPYTYVIDAPGVTSDMVPLVTFDVESLELYSLAPVAETIDNGVVVYCSQQNISEPYVKIKSIVCYSSKGGT